METAHERPSDLIEYKAWVRSRQCGEKIQYPSRMVAENMRTLLSWIDPEHAENMAYPCPWSPSGYLHWHLGHKRKSGRKKIA